MEKALISVIVAIYNVEPYLNKCIQSIVKQRYTNLEILLIDDGSIDKSAEICDKWANQDSRIKVVHKKNGGLSDARNYGLNIAEGKYIGFVDGDDYISDDMYEILYDCCQSNNAQIAVGSLTALVNDKQIRDYNGFKIYNTKEEFIKDAFKGTLSVSVCNKLYNASVFKELRFNLGKTSEEAFIFLGTVEKSTRFVFNGTAKYYYVHRENSITTAHYSSKIYNVIDAYKQNYDIIETKYPDIIKVAEYRLFWAYRLVIDQIMLFSNYTVYMNEIKTLQGIIQKNFFKILLNPYTKCSQKIAYIMIASNLSLYLAMKKRLGSRY